MTYSASHRVSICTSCRHKGRSCKPGYALIKQLHAAVEAAGGAVGDDFEIAGTACMTGCDRPCVVAYHVSRSAAYMFGDVDPDDDIDDLIDFAREYAVLHDGWCGAPYCPGAAHKTTLTRVPAAIIAVQESAESVS